MSPEAEARQIFEMAMVRIEALHVNVLLTASYTPAPDGPILLDLKQLEFRAMPPTALARLRAEAAAEVNQPATVQPS